MPPSLSHIAPFESQEAYQQALLRLLAHPILPEIARRYFPTVHRGEFVKKISLISSAHEFQTQVIAPALESMLEQSSDGFSYQGMEHLSPDEKYVLISNHRDIVVDPALTCLAFSKEGFSTPQICLGDNLLVNDWITDMVKVNKGVTVRRSLKSRELLRASLELSTYIRQTIEQKKDSVWIAQREGRTKDGRDRTQPGILKMLQMAFESKSPLALRELHMVPVTISYEYEPCGFKKAREVWMKKNQGSYQKEADEDYQSMIEGIVSPKGRIHLEIGRPIEDEFFERLKGLELKKEQNACLVEEIDRRILKGYRLFPTSYLAAEKLGRLGQHHRPPTAQEKARFEAHLAHLDPRYLETYLEILSAPLFSPQDE